MNVCINRFLFFREMHMYINEYVSNHFLPCRCIVNNLKQTAIEIIIEKGEMSRPARKPTLWPLRNVSTHSSRAD